jgi:hypothetical protein
MTEQDIQRIIAKVNATEAKRDEYNGWPLWVIAVLILSAVAMIAVGVAG